MTIYLKFNSQVNNGRLAAIIYIAIKFEINGPEI